MPEHISHTVINGSSNVYVKEEEELPASWENRLEFKKAFEQEAFSCFLNNVIYFRQALDIGCYSAFLTFFDDARMLYSMVNVNPLTWDRFTKHVELEANGQNKKILDLSGVNKVAFSEAIMQILEALSADEELFGRLLVMWTGSKSLSESFLQKKKLIISFVRVSRRTHANFQDYSFAESDPSQNYMTKEKYRQFLGRIARLQSVQLCENAMDELVADKESFWSCKAMTCGPLLMVPLMSSTLQVAKAIAFFLNMSEDMTDKVR